MLLDRLTIVPLIAVIIWLIIIFNDATQPTSQKKATHSLKPVNNVHTTSGQTSVQITGTSFSWSRVPDHYPAGSFRSLPTPNGQMLPNVQAFFPAETETERNIRLARLDAVKSNFTHAWNGYKKHAWLHDEVQPLTGRAQDAYGGWAATLIDSLGASVSAVIEYNLTSVTDTLWIMNKRQDFDEAVATVSAIDFSTTSANEINVFETTIRHLGGLLSAYDLSSQMILLDKAKELGDMLFKAFDTPDRMLNTRWRHGDALRGIRQDVPTSMFLAEVGSMSLEFTRLSQLTGDNRYYDAVQRVMDVLDAQQMTTKLPGLWPMNINLRERVADNHGIFTIGGRADSTYEYLIKQHILLGGATEQYARMYERALATMTSRLFYRPMTRTDADILLAGDVHSQLQTKEGKLRVVARAEHLSCFAGGMVLLGAKTLQSAGDMEVGKKLTEGCLWAYETMPEGIMPEIIHTLACDDVKDCSWNSTTWQKVVDSSYDFEYETEAQQKRLMDMFGHGITRVEDARYILRPEAIESVFYQYRITGDRTLQDRAWRMFNAIISKTKTDIAHAALTDCTRADSPKQDRMESFWLAETLKYFYLIFSEPDIISLDEFVLNTEAHPLRRPRGSL